MRYIPLLTAAVIGLTAALPTHQLTARNSPSQCNGSPELCDRMYSNITFIGTHDSAFVGTGMSDNQVESVEQQLDSGIRFLQSQTHKDVLGTLSMCHTSCYLKDAGSVEHYLTTVRSWLDRHTTEVVTLLLTNGDNVDVSMFDDAFTSADLKKYAYIPANESISLNSWPTLGDMINSNKRLVVFLDYGADQSTVPYILSEFDSYIFETPFDTTDPTFPQCSWDRPGPAPNAPAPYGPSPPTHGRMYLVNHYLDKDWAGVDFPDKSSASQTNSDTGPGSIMAQANLCAQQYGRNPNFVLVDWFGQGDVFGAQKALNFPGS